MGNLIRAEIYKIVHRKTLKICMAFIIVIEFLNAFLHGGTQLGTMTLLIEIIGLMACALFSGLSVGAEYGSRTIFHTVTSGKSRGCVWFSKFTAFSVGCLLILAVNALAVDTGFLLFHGMGTEIVRHAGSKIASMLTYTVAGMFYDLCLVSLFFFLAMQIRESGIAIAASAALTALIISNSDFLWVDRLFPLMNGDAAVELIPMGIFLIVILIPVVVIGAGIWVFGRRDL